MSGCHSWISISDGQLWVQFPLEAISFFAETIKKTLDVNFAQKCQICVIYENLEYLGYTCLASPWMLPKYWNI